MENVKAKKMQKKNYLKRALVQLLAFCMIFQNAMYSAAGTLTDAIILSDFDNNPIFNRLLSNDEYQYTSNSYMEQSAPQATTMAGFFNNVRENHQSILTDPVFVPIGVGSITTFIPTFPEPKYIGSPLVQSRYIRYQIRNLLGRHLIDAEEQAYSSESAQINTLYQNAIAFIQNERPGTVFGENLNLDQEASGLVDNIVWPEYRVIHGERVLVPVVYLTQNTVDTRRVDNHEITLLGQANFNTLFIDNVDVKLGRDSFLEVAGNLINREGSLNGSGDLKISVNGALANISGIIQAEGDLSLDAHSISNQTIVHRYDFGTRQGGRFGGIASIDSQTGNVVLDSETDILIEGGIVAANHGAITFDAGGDILVGSVQYTEFDYDEGAGWNRTESLVNILQSRLTAEQTIKLMAENNIKINASEILTDQGHINLLAGLGITVEDAQQESLRRSHFSSSRSTRDVEEYKTVAIRSILDAGRSIRLHTESGNINLRAVDISSTDGTSVEASDGEINLLMAVETDHYSYNEVREGLFTVSSISRGHTIETAVPNTIIGGFEAQALYGVNVSYEGDPELTFEEQIGVLSGFEGMEWMQDILENNPNVDWNAVDLVYRRWNDTSTSLGPAAIALITVIVSVVTAGAGASFVGAAGTTTAGTTSTLGVAFNAGFTAAVNTATVATANVAVNGGDFEDVLTAGVDALHSEEGIRTVLTAAITAGAIAELNSQFFSPNETDISNAINDTEERLRRTLTDAERITVANAVNISLSQQAVQAVVNGVARVGIRTLISGDSFGDFDEDLKNTLLQSAINTIGQRLTTEIGIAARATPPDINTAIQYIANAGVGCAIGAGTASLNDTDIETSCLSGAGGAVIGEVIGQAHRQELEDDLDIWLHNTYGSSTNYTYAEFTRDANGFLDRGVDIGRLAAAFTAFAVGGNVDAAATGAQTAATYNATGGRAALLSVGAFRAASQLHWIRNNPNGVILNEAAFQSNRTLINALNNNNASNTATDNNCLCLGQLIYDGLEFLYESSDSSSNIRLMLTALFFQVQVSNSLFGGFINSGSESVSSEISSESEEVTEARDFELRLALDRLSFAELERQAAIESADSFGFEPLETRRYQDAVDNISRALGDVLSIASTSPEMSRLLFDQDINSSTSLTPPEIDNINATELIPPTIDDTLTMIFENWDAIADGMGLIDLNPPGFEHDLVPTDSLGRPIIDPGLFDPIFLSENINAEETNTNFIPAPETLGVNFNFTDNGRGTIEFSTKDLIITGESSVFEGEIGEVLDRGFETAHLQAHFDESSGELYIVSMASSLPIGHVGRDLISRSIEYFGVDNIKTIRAKFAHDNLDAFNKGLDSDLNIFESARNTPFGRALRDLGFDDSIISVNTINSSLPQVVYRIQE